MRRSCRGSPGYLILCGVVLLALGIGLLLLELRGPGSDEASPGRSAALRLTVPELERVRGMPVETASSGDEEALRRGPVRLAGTGLPSQTEPNVYISGYRLGYPGTDGFLVFRDLNKLGPTFRTLLQRSG